MRRGRFKKPAAELARRYTESVSFDHRKLDVDLVKILDLRKSLAQRQAVGAPSSKNVKQQLKRWRAILKS